MFQSGAKSAMQITHVGSNFASATWPWLEWFARSAKSMETVLHIHLQQVKQVKWVKWVKSRNIIRPSRKPTQSDPSKRVVSVRSAPSRIDIIWPARQEHLSFGALYLANLGTSGNLLEPMASSLTCLSKQSMKNNNLNSSSPEKHLQLCDNDDLWWKLFRDILDMSLCSKCSNCTETLVSRHLRAGQLLRQMLRWGLWTRWPSTVSRHMWYFTQSIMFFFLFCDDIHVLLHWIFSIFNMSTEALALFAGMKHRYWMDIDIVIESLPDFHCYSVILKSQDHWDPNRLSNGVTWVSKCIDGVTTVAAVHIWPLWLIAWSYMNHNALV